MTRRPKPRLTSPAAKAAIRRMANRFGLEVNRYASEQSHTGRRAYALRALGVSCLLDVGAHTGQFVEEARALGYPGRAISFEPLAEPFAVLERAASRDPHWSARKLAIGDSEGSAEIHVAGNALSSSLLPMEERHVKAAPQSAYVRTEQVQTATLDGAVGIEAGSDERFFLKIDVQGYEFHVLDGASDVLSQTVAVECELSAVPLYQSGPLLGDVLARLRDEGLVVVSLDPVFWEPESGYVLQWDGLFVRQ
jgi:FkbM family methyltransferase